MTQGISNKSLLDRLVVDGQRGTPGDRRRPENQTPEQREATLARLRVASALSRKRLSEGMLIFVSKETRQQLEQRLGRAPTNRMLRTLLAQIGTGELVVHRAQATTVPVSSITKVDASATHGNGATQSPAPQEPLFSLRQAATLLQEGRFGQKQTMSRLYHRCVQHQIRFVRQRSRYFLPEAEVNRLREVGL